MLTTCDLSTCVSGPNGFNSMFALITEKCCFKHVQISPHSSSSNLGVESCCWVIFCLTANRFETVLSVENTPTAAHLVPSEPTATLFYELFTNTDFEWRLWRSNSLLIFIGHVSLSSGSTRNITQRSNRTQFTVAQRISRLHN